MAWPYPLGIVVAIGFDLAELSNTLLCQDGKQSFARVKNALALRPQFSPKL